MALTRKNLAFGQLPIAAGNLDLYVAPALTTGLVHHIMLHNTGGTVETVVLRYFNGGTPFAFLEASLSAKETLFLDFRGEGFVVAAGGKIIGLTTTAATVTHKIDGTEET